MPSRARTLTLLLAAALVAWPADAPAQCALCRTAAEQAGAETAHALNLGILMLLIPPVAIFCAIFAVAVRHHKEGGGEE